MHTFLEAKKSLKKITKNDEKITIQACRESTYIVIFCSFSDFSQIHKHNEVLWLQKVYLVDAVIRSHNKSAN